MRRWLFVSVLQLDVFDDICMPCAAVIPRFGCMHGSATRCRNNVKHEPLLSRSIAAEWMMVAMMVAPCASVPLPTTMNPSRPSRCRWNCGWPWTARSVHMCVRDSIQLQLDAASPFR